LPDLNEARNRPAHEPRAVPPVPSTRRRCPPHNRRCNGDESNAPRPDATPAPTPRGSRAEHAGESSGLIARLAGQSLLTLVSAALNGGGLASDTPLPDFYASDAYSVSDSEPSSPLSAPADYAAAAALPFVQAQETPQPFVTGMSLGAMRSDSPGWTGFQITTGAQPLTLTALGRLCSPNNSLLHELRVVRASDNVLLATTSVSMSGCTVNQFKYEDLPTPVTLAANTAYVMVSYEAGGDLFHDWTNSWLTTTSAAAINGAIYTVNGGQTWSLATGNGNSYVPVDFKYVPGTPSVNFVTGRTSGAMRADSPGWTGFQMTTASQPLTVTSLGRLCLPNNSLSHDLKIVRASDNVTIATTTVSMSSCTVNQFKYATLASPATLAANTSYVLVSYEVGGDLFYDWTGQWLSTTSVATINGAIYTVNGGQTWSLATGNGNSYVPVDFKYQTDEQGVGTGLTAKYYDNIDFTSYKFTRTDPTVNFDWGNGTPSATMGADQFSVRWAGMVVPRYSQTYTFYTTSDDGVRLWVDGQLIIDKWIDQGPTTWSGQVALQAGRQYDIRVEFYENFGGAQVKLEWQSASQAREVVPQSRLYGCWKEIDRFVKDFFQAALARQPNAAELQDWTGRLAQAQGESQLIEEARTLGISLFNVTSPSSAYNARSRSDGDFITDLYLGYLQRDPDQAGWNYWLGQLPSMGRGNMREAFAQSPEFQEKVRRLCGTSAAADVNAGTGYNFTTARLDPDNRTGSGTDAYSRNFGFSIPVLSLPGRDGLDLGLALSYNSLVWTKDTTGITYDADNGFPGPGFHLGFPVIQPKFVNPQIQQAGQAPKSSYLLVTPSGGRVELRQTAMAGVYESADSSYLQLVEGGGSPQTLVSTDGTQLSYTLVNGEFRCYQVKDSNGNYISVAYYADGRIDRVIDTLGRTITFRYDAYQNLTSIEQPWRRDTETNPNPTQDETHVWATFGYTNVTLQPSFSNLAVMGDQPGTIIPALSQVGLDDGSYYKFSYNQWGQVWKATHYAADSLNAQGQPNDSHALNYTRLDLPGSDLTAASPQTDCPRFKDEKTWVENGLMNQSGEVTTSYELWSPDMASCEVTMPDRTTKQVGYYGTPADGWKKGLTTSQQVSAFDPAVGQVVLVKTTTLSWEHDGSVNAPYPPTNPRVTQQTISDMQGNTRTTRVTYTVPSDFQGESGYTGNLNVSLPKKVEDCDANCANVLRTTITDYKVANLSEYVSRRILGLPRYQYIYEGGVSAGSLRSQLGYVYDEPNDAQDTFLAAVATVASQHDGANYGQGLRWRGNANRVRRYSVDQQNGAVGAPIESRSAYNITGTVAYKKDAAGHKTSFSYTDSFFQNINRTNADPQYQLKTYAYPTTVTDPDNFTATVVYNYDMGLVRQAQTPLPNVATNQPGPTSVIYYDKAGRVAKTVSVDTGAYTRMVYADSMTLAQTYTLIDAGVERYSANVLDGAGRVRAKAATLPNSSGGYAGQFFDYDSMGRLARQSNPAATSASGSWPVTDEDAANGWLYTQTTYDWKGRPLTITDPPTAPGAAAATKEFLYKGCGCAGGETATTRDEVGRRVRVTHDVLGRVWKTQVLSQQPDKPQPFTDGPNEPVYTSTTNTYDALDHVKEIRVRAESNGVEQVTTKTYDGYGRLATEQGTEQTAPITYLYYDDDTVRQITDARGASTAFTYNGRHLGRTVTFVAAGGAESTTNLEFQYDAAGNRLWMTDAAGRVDYQYNVLSRLTSEIRYFNLLARSYTIGYSYNLGGQLSGVTDPFGASFSYQRDAAGQLTAVTGSPSYAGVTNYIWNIRYRAWGAVKSASYGNNSVSTTQYDGRLQPTQFRLTDATSGASLQREDYSYYADGHLSLLTDLDDAAGSNPPSSLRFLSRTYSYDLAGRVTDSRGTHGAALPLLQTYGYDEFDNLTYRSGSYYDYNGSLTQTDTAHFTNNRRDGWTYDADGRFASSPATSSSYARNPYYDAAGRQVRTVEAHPASSSSLTDTATYDGNGRVVYATSNDSVGTGIFSSSYTLRATALGGEVLTTLNSSGDKAMTYVPAMGLLFARQVKNPPPVGDFVSWTQRDPVGVSETNKGIYDPLGNYIPFKQPTDPRPPAGSYNSGSMASVSGNMSDAYNYGLGCMLHGIPTKCSTVMRMLGNGSAGGGVISGTGNPLVELAGMGLIFTSNVYTGAAKFNYFYGMLYEVDISRVVEGQGINLSSAEKEAGYGPLNIIVYGLTLAPGRQPGVEPNQPQQQNSAAVDRKIRENIKTCALLLYGVELKDFNPAAPGRGGSFVGFGFDRNKGEYADIRIDTNVTTYDRADLNTFYESFVKDHPGVLVPQPAGNNAWGLTLPNSMVRYGNKPGAGFSPYLNFLAKDIPKQWNNSAWFELLQIHEIGHALAFLTRDKIGQEDGKEFEDCVYDGPRATWKRMKK
jgi:YD repeat-containing protein